MMTREQKDLSPVLVRVGVALALSFASFLFSRVRGKKLKSLPPPPPFPTTPGHANDHDDDKVHSDTPRIGLKDEQSDHQRIQTETSFADPMNDVVKEIDISVPCLDKEMYEEEIKQLKNMVEVLHERESNLEVQLLEYYGLNEQEAASVELQNRLKLNSMESKLLSMKIESLQEHNRKLQQQVADHAQVVADLETARSKIGMLRKKLRSESDHNREQILRLQKRVEKLQIMERDTEMQANLQKLEDQVEELTKSNMRLHHENNDLLQRLESTQILANCILEDPQTEALKREKELLRQEKESLREEVEQLQSNRCSDIEELVYLRWINACLRYELRNYQPPEGKTVARDLSKTLSPKSEEKAKQLILQYATTGSEVVPEDIAASFNLDSDQWSSSSNYLTDYSGDLDDYSSFDTCVSTKMKKKKKNKLFGKLRKLLILGKDGDGEEEDNDHKSSRSRGLSSSRHSLDIQWLRNLETEEDSLQKDDITKYAKALKGSLEEGRQRKLKKSHRKTPSAGSLHSIV